MRKVRTVQDSNLKIYLNRMNDQKDVELTCMAFVKFKLLSFDENIASIHKVLTAVEFGAGNPSMIGLPLISLNDIQNPNHKFIQNDTIELEIYVVVDPPQTVFQNDLARLQIISNDRSTINFDLTVKVTEKRVALMSPIFFLCKIPWQIYGFQNGDTLDIALRPIHKELINCTRSVTITIKLLPFKQLQNIHEQSFSGTIDRNNSTLVLQNFIQWDQLVNGFVHNGSIKLDIVIVAIEAQYPAAPSQRLNENGIICPICFDSLLDVMAVSLKCGHMFCQPCAASSIRSKKVCPICRTKAFTSQVRPTFIPMQ